MAKQKREIVAVFSAQNKAKGVMAGFRRGLDSTGQAMKRMAKVGAVMAVAAAAGLAYLVKRQMEAIDVIAKLSDRLGIATEDLVGLQHAASISGVSTEALNKSLEMFVRRLGEMTMGSGEAQRGLEMLGLTTEELIRLSPAEAMGIAADKINRLETQAEKAAAAYFLFGRAGAQLVNMFAVGSEGLREFQKEAEKLGLTFSRFDAAQIEAANDALTRARATMTGLFRQVTIELAPYIEVLANKFVDLATSGEGVGANVVNAFESMSLAALKFGEIMSGLPGYWKAIEAAGHEYLVFHYQVGDAITNLDVLFKKLRVPKFEKTFKELIEEHGQKARKLLEAGGTDLAKAMQRQSAVEKFYDDLRKKAARETTKTIKEQYADVLQAKIDMVEAELARIKEASESAKQLAEEDKKVIIAAAKEQVEFVRQQDYMTRTQRIQNLEAYKAAHQETLDLVLEAEKILADELEKLERGKLDALKQWGRDASDVWLNIDKIAVSALDGMADALTELCLTGKADFKALAQSVISDIIRMMIKMQMAQALGIGGTGPGIGSLVMAGIGDLFGGATAGIPTTATRPSTVGPTLVPSGQYGGEVWRTGLAVIHKGETFSGVNRDGEKSIDVHIHNEQGEDREISHVENYIVSDQRIIDVFTRKAQTDGPLRRSIRQVSK